jgi:hypothetical protein
MMLGVDRNNKVVFDMNVQDCHKAYACARQQNYRRRDELLTAVQVRIFNLNTIHGTWNLFSVLEKIG